MLSCAYSLTRASAFQIHQGPTSLRLIISQFKDIINHTQNKKLMVERLSDASIDSDLLTVDPIIAHIDK